MWSMLLLALTCISTSVQTSTIDYETQKRKIDKARTGCTERLAAVGMSPGEGIYCEPVWDDITCWPNYVKAGQIATQSCPSYIQGFNSFEKARRYCTNEGTWEKHPGGGSNRSWTNFSDCLKSSVPAIIEVHMPIVIKISTIGYSISLGTLIIAMFIMVVFKKLHCQRNTIHLNLFLSFILRAVISLLRNRLLVRHFALPSDITYRHGRIVFIEEGTHWECKLLNTLWQYSLNANYMWIFVEGLYLHTLIFFAVFSQSKRFFKLYIIIGWGFPLVFIMFWVIARVFRDNTFCWNTHSYGYYWILNTPIVTSISVNFFFFLNVIRVLFTKIRDCNTRDPRRYRKLAKSTLVLIPLFGVYYMFFILLSLHDEDKITVVHMYMEMTLNSFQGTVIALLFCFLNGEVRGEIIKKWHRHRLRKQSIVSGRSSRTLSTTSFYTGKQRSSLTQGATGSDNTDKVESPTSLTSFPLTKENCDTFRKVSSMPKLSLNSFSGMKAIPRVSSSSRVSFDSTLHSLDGAPFSCVPALGDILMKQASTGSNYNEEEDSLLLNRLGISNDNNENIPSCSKQSNTLLSQTFAICRSRDVDKTSLLGPCVSGLSPLPDIQEDITDSLATVQ